MIESPVLREFVAERSREIILEVLIGRFGPTAQTMQSALDTIDDDAMLKNLARRSGTCPDLESFKEELSQDSLALMPGVSRPNAFNKELQALPRWAPFRCTTATLKSKTWVC